jgi:hypothetical protein
MSETPKLPRVLLALSLLLYAYNTFRYHDYLIDDTYISVRYAKNLAEGHGPIFNPGEKVEGYTNFSFVLIAALFLRLGVEPVFGVKLVSFGMSLLLLGVLGRLERPGLRLREAFRSPPRAWLFLVPLQAFAYWTYSGMETMIFAALFLAGLALCLQESASGRSHGSVWVFVLLALTRPEGVFVFGLCTGVFFVAERLQSGSWAHLGRHLRSVAIFTLVYGAYFLWRWSYYGHLLPNTFYAKVTGSSAQWINGLGYLGRFAMAFPLLGLTLLAPLGWAVPSLRGGLRLHRSWVVLWLIALLDCGYIVAVGGDFMAYYRFFVPLLPVVCLLLIRLVERLRPGALLALWLFHWVWSFWTTQPEVAFVAHRFTVIGRIVGQWLAKEAEPTDWIAVNTAGAVPYFSGLPAIDMLGLTDEAIAHRPVYIVSPGWGGHQRGWGEYVLSRRPRFVFWYNMAGLREPFYLTDHELADDPAFRFFYQLKTVTLPTLADPARGPQVVERFFGFPFGNSPRGQANWDEMGLRAEFREAPLPMTALTEGQVVLNYFERDQRDDGLWELRSTLKSDPDRFLEQATGLWRASKPADFDPKAREQVEAMCLAAERMLRSGRPQEATRLLTEAERLDRRAGSPLVYQYLANVSVLAGDPFMAVRAQKEALRLAPDNALYRRNLKALLTTSYEAIKKGRASDEAR